MGAVLISMCAHSTLLFLAIAGLSISIRWVSARKNILFIASDDLRPNLGVYDGVNSDIFDSPNMVTPNIDKLAEKSILFERAYVQYAVCSPSRSSLLTGRRPDTTHITDLESYFRNIGGNFTTIPQFFKHHGYKAINVGKVFHRGHDASGPGSGDDDVSWTSINHAKSNSYYHGSGRSWEAVSKDKLPLQDTVEADIVISKLREIAPDALVGEQQFFLGWGLHRPHLPFLYPEEFGALYEDSRSLPRNPFAPFQMPTTAWSNWGELREYKDIAWLDNEDLGQINVTLPDWKTKDLRQAYYSSISHVDHEVGRVLDELDTLGLAENTIIALWGDHGWQLGEHSEWCKHTNFEVATRAPLMMRIPELTDGGLRTNKLVEFVDIFPTLVEATGFPSMELCSESSSDVRLCTEGTSLMPLVSDPDQVQWKDAVFWQYRRGGKITEHISKIMGYTIRTDQYRFTEWTGITYLGGNGYEPNWDDQKDHPELYDLLVDPEENNNLYNDPNYTQINNNLRKKLRAGWREARP